MVGIAGFEPATPGPPDQCANLTAPYADDWYGRRDSNPQNSEFKTDTYANSVTPALVEVVRFELTMGCV